MKGFIRLSRWLVFLLVLAGFSPAFGAEDELVSIDNNGQSIFGAFPSISADGRYVTFSQGTVPASGKGNVYVRDRQSGKTELISVSSEGVPGNGVSYGGVVSSDGKFVAYYSYATNLIQGADGKNNLLLHDRVTGRTEQIDLSVDGGQPDKMLFYYPYQGIQVTMSDDARFVVFESNGSNLVHGDIGYSPDVFVRDRLTGTTEMISVDSTGSRLNGSSYSPAINADGRFVAFFYSPPEYYGSSSSRLQYLMIRDRKTGTTEKVGQPIGLVAIGIPVTKKVSISADGRYVGFSSIFDNLVQDDSNGKYDVFLYDRQIQSMEKVSTSEKISNWPSLSADGRFAAFSSQGSNITPDDYLGGGVFVRDRSTGVTERIESDFSNSWPDMPAISADGRFVVYRHKTESGTRLFLHDRQKITANAGPDQTVEQTTSVGAPVTLDGSASTSGCSDPLTYAWSWSGGYAEGIKPIVQLPAGETTVTLKVSACGTTVTDTAVIKVADTLPPVSSATVSGTKGSDDWFVSVATVTIAATDSGSGVKEIHYRVNDDAEKVIPGAAGSFNLGTDGNYSITYYAVDNAGIPEGEKSPLNVKVDTTPPVSAVTVDGTAGLNGWYTSAATLSFTVSDYLSGVREIHYSSNPNSEIIVTGAATGLTLTADGSYNVSYYAIDTAGNVEIPQKDQAVNIDATPPNIIIGGATNGATYSLGLVPIASYTVSDAASGVAASNAALSGGDSFGLGAFTYSVTAEDNAGNSAFADASYEVIATPEGLTALIGQLLTSGKIDNTGIANSLISKLENAQKANGNAADNIMQAFINQVEAQSGGRISSDAAAILIHAAEYIISN